MDELIIGVPVEPDPAWSIVGLCDSGPNDLSTNPDRYLAQIFDEEHSR